MMARAVLRGLAVAIAAAALIDPAFTRDRTARQRLAIVTMHDDDVRHAERLQRRLVAEYDATIAAADPASLAAACPSTGGCILVSRGAVPRRLTAGATVVGALRVTADHPPRAIRGVEAPRAVHRDAAAALRVTLTRPADRVDVFDGDVLVGSASPGDALAVEVPWVPLGAGARALRIVAAEDEVDVGVIVEAAPAALVVHEPEPTWMGTFVRRALDDDLRFAVAGRTRAAPAIAISRGGVGTLSAAALGDAGAVIVTAPQALTAADVDLLERFVVNRGGSLIVVLDRRPAGAASRLLPRVAGQQRETQPRDAGLLKVREWLTFDRAAGASTLAAVGEDPVIVARAAGRGRVIVSGALDSWRFRDATSNFNTFWTALAWDAVVAAGRRLDVTVEHVLVRPGEPIRVGAELQSIDPLPAELQASAVMTCAGSGDRVRQDRIRLWPGGRRGTFEGVMRPVAGACQLAITVNGETAAVPVIAREDARRGGVAADALAAAAAAHGGIVADAGDGEGDLATHAGAVLSPTHSNQTVRPMRSPYWLILFAACLSSEWWLRRRSGLS